MASLATYRVRTTYLTFVSMILRRLCCKQDRANSPDKDSGTNRSPYYHDKSFRTYAGRLNIVGRIPWGICYAAVFEDDRLDMAYYTSDKSPGRDGHIPGECYIALDIQRSQMSRLDRTGRSRRGYNLG